MGYTSDYAQSMMDGVVNPKSRKAGKSKKISGGLREKAHKKMLSKKSMEELKKRQKGTPNDPNY